MSLKSMSRAVLLNFLLIVITLLITVTIIYYSPKLAGWQYKRILNEVDSTGYITNSQDSLIHLNKIKGLQKIHSVDYVVDKMFDYQSIILSIVGGIAVIVGVFLNLKNAYLSEKGHFTDRFSKAIEHLGNDKFSIQIGGVYSLESLIKERPEFRSSIIEVLCSFIRESAPSNKQGVTSFINSQVDSLIRESQQITHEVIVAHDIDEQLESYVANNLINSSIGVMRRNSILFSDSTRINLSSVILKSSDLSGANLTSAKFDYSIFNRHDFNNCLFNKLLNEYVIYSTVYFRDSFIKNCFFKFHFFKSTYFINTKLKNTSFKTSIFNQCEFDGCIFDNVDFSSVYHEKSSFSGSNFKSIKIGNSSFYDCKFTKAEFKEIIIEGTTFINCDFTDALIDVEQLLKARSLFNSVFDEEIGLSIKTKKPELFV